MMNMRTKARTLLAGLTLTAALSLPALGLPEGGQVVNGQVNIGSPLNGQMTIQQLTDHAIINWNAFGINATEMLRFVQPSQLSAILNRVTGQDPSVIMGSLQANGRVFIINPNGILFGAGSQVNVGSLFASTLNITDDNFLHDRFKFDQVEGKAAASIVNQGTLTVSPGGFLVLTSPLIANQGVIVANVGQVALAAGQHTEVNFDGQGLINIQVDPAVAGQTGPVAINNGMLNNMVGGLLSLGTADTVTQLPDGVELAGASGRLINTGEIHADALPGQTAGHIVLNSEQATLVRSGSLISANGVDKMDGGSIKLLSNGLASLEQGAVVQAQGGSLSGNGGFIELSGKGGIRVEGNVDVSALQGTAGVFLLDPATLDIINTTGSLDGSIAGNGNSTQGLNPGGASTVSNTFINSFSSGTLTLQADNTITQANNAPINNTNAGVNLVFLTSTGDITFNSVVATTGTITATAGQNVAFNNNIQGTTVTLTAGGTGSVSDNSGTHFVVGSSGVNLTGPGGVFGQTFVFPNLAATSALRTQTPVLNVTASGASSNIFVINNAIVPGAASVNATAGNGAFIVNSGTLTVGSTGIRGSALGTGVVINGAGDVVNDANSGTIGAAGSLTEIKADNIGSTATPVKTAGATVNLFAGGTSGATVSQTGSAVFNLNVTNGPTNITSTGDIGLGTSTFADPLNGNAATAFTTSASNPLTINTTGKIENSGAAPVLKGSTITLNGANGVGSLGALQVQSATVNSNSTNGNIQLAGNQASIYNVTAPAGTVSVTSPHPIDVGASGIRGNSGTTVTATGAGASGDITNTGNGVIGQGGTTTISGNALGVAGTPLQTAGSTLSFTAVAGAFLRHNGNATVSGTAGAGVDLDLTGNLAVGTAGIAGTTGTSVNATGDITGSSGFVGTTGTATDLQGNNVGTAGAAVKTKGSPITVTAAAGANIQQTGAATFNLANSNGDVTFASDSNIDIGGVFVHPTGAVTLSTTGGHIQTSTVSLGGTTVNLTAAGPITASTAASNLNATATGGTGSISLTNDRSATVNATAAQAATVSTSAGSLTVGSSGIGGATSTVVSAPASILGGTGRVGVAGGPTTITATDIGTTGTPVKTAGSTVGLTATTVHVDNAGPATFSVTHAGGATDVSILSDATITLATGNFNTNNASTVSLISTGGGLAFSGAAFPIVGNSVTLSTLTDLGTSVTHFQTQANTLSATSTTGSVFVSNTGAVTAGGSAAVNYVLDATAPITLSTLSAVGTANVTSTGDLLGNGAATNLSAGTANLVANGGKIGTDTTNRLNTSATNLNAIAANGVFIGQTGSTTANVTSATGNVDLNVNGDLVLKQIIATTGSVKLQTCPTGSILDGNDGPGVVNNIQAGGDVTMIAHGTVGTDTDAIEVQVPNGVMRAAAGDKINGVSINIAGTTQSNTIEVFDPPAGTACFTGLPPGQGIFNGIVVYTPAAVASNNSGGGAAAQAFFVPDQTRQALDSVLVNPFIFNQPPFLDINGRIMGSAFTPFYTSGLAFLLDKEDWLRFLQETVVWDIDEEEAKDI